MKELWALNFKFILTITLISCSVKDPKSFSSPNNTDKKSELTNFSSIPRIKIKKIKNLVLSIDYNDDNAFKLSTKSVLPNNDHLLRNFLVKSLYKELTNNQNEFNENPLIFLDMTPLNHFSFNEIETLKEKLNESKENFLNLNLSFYIEINSPIGIYELTNLKLTLYSYNPQGSEDNSLTEIKEKLLSDNDFKRITITSKNSFKYLSPINLNFKIPIETIKETLKNGFLTLKVSNFDITNTKNTISNTELLQRKHHFVSTNNSFKSTPQLSVININENTLQAPIDFKSTENMNQGLWRILKFENNKIKIFATKKDLISSNQNKKVLKSFNLENKLILTPIYPFETLILGIKASRFTPSVSKPISTSLEVGSIERRCSRNLVREPLECHEVFKYGKWCGITHTTPTGGIRQALLINSLSDLQFKIKAKFKNKIISNLLSFISKKDYFINKNKTQIKIKLKSRLELNELTELPGLKSLTLINKKPTPINLTYGLTSYTDCKIKNASGFEFKDFNPGPHTITKFEKENYEIILNRISFDEN